MPKLPRKMVTISAETAARVEDFRVQNGIPDYSAAMATLVRKALDWQDDEALMNGIRRAERARIRELMTE